MNNKDFRSILLGRQSIRHYKKDYDVDIDTIKAIFDMALRAPSSKNLQPWSFKIIKSKKAKDVYSHLFVGNRSQYETSSFMVIIFVDKIYAKKASDIYSIQVEKGLLTLEQKENQLENLRHSNISEQSILKNAYLDAGLVAMSLMLTARSFGLDTCPIGGFDRIQAPKAFNLHDQEAVMAISFGIKDEQNHETVRLSFNKVSEIL